MRALFKFSTFSEERNRKNAGAIQILNILDSATRKMRALFKFSTFSEERNRKNAGAIQILNIL
jgi:hypothetical protein